MTRINFPCAKRSDQQSKTKDIQSNLAHDEDKQQILTFKKMGMEMTKAINPQLIKLFLVCFLAPGLIPVLLGLTVCHRDDH